MRIVAGKLKGLKLNTFDYGNIRPTLDSVRESIFNKIQFGVNGSVFLDLFSGTGVFSLEAYSRGAKSVYACDSNSDSIKLIKTNLKKAKVENGISVVQKDYKDTLNMFNSQGVKFDYIFIDPPFESQFGNTAIGLIGQYNLLSEDGVIIYEHSINTVVDNFKNLQVVDEKKYGTILVTYLKVVSNG